MLVVLVAIAITAGPAVPASVTHPPRQPHAARAKANRTAAPKHKAKVKSKKVKAATNTPQEAVQRFLEPRSAADACAQLSRPYQKHLARQYGPCLVAVKANPKVTHLVISNVVVNGKNATLKATYRMPTGPAREFFSLREVKLTWLISGAH